MPNLLHRLTASSLAFLALSASSPAAHAVTKSFCDFKDVSSLVLLGSASQVGSSLQLTPNKSHQVGAAWLAWPVALGTGVSFHTFFRFQIAPAGGGDGFTFVLQSSGAGTQAIGTDGQELGYGGASITPSFAVEFDTYQNPGDPNANHVGILSSGDAHTHLAAMDPGFPLAASGQTGYAWIDIDGTTKEIDVYVSASAAKPAAPLLHTVIAFNLLGGQAYAGFTGSTGGATDLHTILEWDLGTDGQPCCPTAPGAACSGATPVCSSAGVCVAGSSSSSSGSTSSSSTTSSGSTSSSTTSSGSTSSSTTSSGSASSSAGAGGAATGGGSTSGTGGSASGGGTSAGGSGTGGVGGSVPRASDPVVEGGGCVCGAAAGGGGAAPGLTALVVAALLGRLRRRWR